MEKVNRRNFLKYLGQSAAAASLPASILSTFVSHGCSNNSTPRVGSEIPFTPVNPSSEDLLKIADGFNWRLLIKANEPINQSGLKFGWNNDFIAVVTPVNSKSDNLLMWVNHETPTPQLQHGELHPDKKTLDQINIEKRSLGGSILEINKSESEWNLVFDSKYNRRLDAFTKIPFLWDDPIMGTDHAIGTFANCAGGVTPWGTFLSCEENYQNFYGEREHRGDWQSLSPHNSFGWHRFEKYPPEHYGWVVEVDPLTGDAHKLVSMGRFSHESATVVSLPDGRVAVYSGDDKENECIYKFISDKPNSLKTGALYVAQIETGKWIPLDINQSPVLKKHFSNQTEVLTYTRKAAHLLGGSKMDRPEDIEINPINGDIIIALTNNVPAGIIEELFQLNGNYHGSLFKISENNRNYESLNFSSETFLAGGNETGFSCPDNLLFDSKGNLWFTTDVSGSRIGEPPYQQFKNNGLFYIPVSGTDSGNAFQVASAPRDAEFTGPCFSPDEKTLFLSVQHPGEKSKNITSLRSHWPDGGNALPLPAVVQITGGVL